MGIVRWLKNPMVGACLAGMLFFPSVRGVTAVVSASPTASPVASPAATPTALASPPAVAAAPPWRGLPMRTVTRRRVPGDPVNVGVEGSRGALLSAFKTIGWELADPLSLRTDLRLVRDTVLNRLYPTAPVSNLYLFGRSEDLAFERELGSVARRDHVRFWDTRRRDPVSHLELWIGDCSRDVAIKLLRDRHHVPVGVTHRISPDVDAERDLIVHELRAAGLARAALSEPGMGPTRAARNGGGDPFYTDGRVTVVVLRSKI